MKTEMLLAVYENPNLTTTEKDYLLTILTEGTIPNYFGKAKKKLAVSKSLKPAVIASDLAIVGSAGSYVVLYNKLRKATAELQKKTYLFRTTTDNTEKEKLHTEISQLKNQIADLEKKVKIADSASWLSVGARAGVGAVQKGLTLSAKNDVRKGASVVAAVKGGACKDSTKTNKTIKKNWRN